MAYTYIGYIGIVMCVCLYIPVIIPSFFESKFRIHIDPEADLRHSISRKYNAVFVETATLVFSVNEALFTF